MNKAKTYERLDKFLSNAGVASRRSIKHILKTEMITVNGKRVTVSGEHIDPSKDKIEYNGKPLTRKGFVYYMLYKPKNVISTTADEYERNNVVSFIETYERIYPIGRLDKDTTGLILLTNDGILTQRLTHPKFHVPKVYRLTIFGVVDEPQLKALREGVLLSDGITSPAEVEVVKQIKTQTVLEVTLHEGRNRQIRRMCETVGIELLELERIKFGELSLKGLALGAYRELQEEEVVSLKKSAGII
jgi:23S rRNA pseudouridine2605 synthase